MFLKLLIALAVAVPVFAEREPVKIPNAEIQGLINALQAKVAFLESQTKTITEQNTKIFNSLSGCIGSVTIDPPPPVPAFTPFGAPAPPPTTKPEK